MWQKLAVAFLAGGLAVGTAVYFGLRHREANEGAPSPPPVQGALPQPAPPSATEAREVPPPEPAQPAAAVAVTAQARGERPRPAASRATAPRTSQKATPASPSATTAEVAQAAPPAEPAHVQPPVQQDVRVSPPPAPAPQQAAEPVKTAAEKPAPPKREPRTVTVPAGTLISVRLRDALSTERQSTHDAFFATLDAPLIVDGLVIAERGALVRGRVVEAVPSGRVKGRAALVLQLDELTTADGQKVAIQTDSFRHEAPSGVKSDAAKTGVAAGIGAAIGAIAGGGKGAAIGAAIGGAAGAGSAMATRGKPAELPSETRLTFRLSEPVTLTERLP